MDATTSTNAFPAEPFTIESVKAAMAKMAAIDFPVRVRLAPCAMAYLRAACGRAKDLQPVQLPRAIDAPFAPLTGLSIETDYSLHGMAGETDYRRRRKMDINRTAAASILNAAECASVDFYDILRRAGEGPAEAFAFERNAELRGLCLQAGIDLPPHELPLAPHREQSQFNLMLLRSHLLTVLGEANG